jgi:outer membrane receptor protein involved in Fe transport
MLEHDFTEDHLLSTGLSLNGDRYDETLLSNGYSLLTEYTPGAYVQYTYTPSYKFTLMGGLRVDHSTLYDRSYVTPRMHVKWVTGDHLTLRASVGKGYRTPHAMAEQHYLLASGRTLTAPAVLPQEEAWNSGLSATLYLHLWEKSVQVNAEYYYTDFLHQAVVDYDSDPSKITIADLNGKSYSHTLQLDASCDITDELNILAAFRYNHVRCTYGGVLMEKPLQSRYKGLVTVGWKPMMGIWQLDVTLSLNGGGRMPTPYTLGDGSASWDKEFPAYPQLSAQLTREFRHFSVYIGGENLTGYRQPNPIINAATPWSADFEPTLVWGPVHGTMVYAGIRANL